MLKWRLMLTTLPFVVVIAAVKAGLEFGIGWSGVVEFSDIGPVLTGGVFLTGILLAGTMSDYKESEKLPGELADKLEAVEEIVVSCAADEPKVNLPLARKQLLELVDAIRDWFYGRMPKPSIFEHITKFHGHLIEVQTAGAGAAGIAMGELASVRKMVTRIGVISRTGFLPPAYALLEALTFMILGLALAAKFKSTLAEFILVPFITLIYVYMLRLIRDIDDPFDYTTDGVKRGGAEVELFPIEEYRARLAERVGKSA